LRLPNYSPTIAKHHMIRRSGYINAPNAHE
jgi:hypothetical protein